MGGHSRSSQFAVSIVPHSAAPVITSELTAARATAPPTPSRGRTLPAGEPSPGVLSAAEGARGEKSERTPALRKRRLRELLLDNGFQSVNVDVSQRQERQQADRGASGEFPGETDSDSADDASGHAADNGPALAGDRLLDTFA